MISELEYRILRVLCYVEDHDKVVWNLLLKVFKDIEDLNAKDRDKLQELLLAYPEKRDELLTFLRTIKLKS